MSIKDAFNNQGYDAEFAFGNQGDQSEYKGPVQAMGGGSVSKAIKGALKLWPWLYYSLVFKKYFKRQDILEKQLKAGSSYDLVVEFHTVGSRLGANLAKHWGAKFSAIFDSPVDEQFMEMHGTKSVHWKRICESEKETMQAADRIMFYSPACMEHVRSKYSATAKMNVLPSLLNKPLDYKRVQKPGFRIGFIGSFLSWHKIDLMVDVFHKFNQKHPETVLQLIGYGQEWNRVSEKVKTLGLQDKVEMPGFVSEEELSKLKSEFSIAVMPGSNWYGSPLKLFEYAQGGIPFVAPVSKTVQSVFEDGIHCLNVKAENEFDSLYQALETYYSDPERAEKIGSAAKNYVATNFGKEIYETKLVDYLGLN